MANHGLRASWIATTLAAVLAMGTPVVASVAGGESGSSAAGSDARAARHPFTDRGPRPATDVERGTAPARPAHRDGRPASEGEHLLVRVPRSMVIKARPDADAAVIGTLPSGSKYYGVPMTAALEAVSDDGRWGRVEIPYVWPRRDGWIPLRNLRRSSTHVEVEVDLSAHRISVTKFGRTLFGLRAATGAAASPTPPGAYFVTDRIPFSEGSSLGSFAFGISGIQPNLPPGWSGGNQLAIHGTNDPSSIGRSASAGCLRVSESALDRLKPLLRLGTPVIVHR
jgi:lipoprotein-anchoring transpeptidase ErfK/SrfK